MKITVPNIDDSCDASYTVYLSPKEYTEAVQAGAEAISAVQVGKNWYYQSEEDKGGVHRVTAKELAMLGAADGRGYDYSLWCSMTGFTLQRIPSAVKRALGITA